MLTSSTMVTLPLSKVMSADPRLQPALPPEVRLAFAAWNGVDRAMAVIARDGGLLLSNPAFDELVHAVDIATQRGFYVDLSALGPRLTRWVLDDGRILDVNVKPLEEGLVIQVWDQAQGAAHTTADIAAVDSDPVSGLANHSSFKRRLKERLGTIAVDQDDSVIVVELDRFEAIEESLGEVAGDALLGVAAGRLRSTLGATDLAARTGDHEFAVLLHGGPESEVVVALAKRIVDLLGRSYIIDGQLLNIGANAGIAAVNAAALNTDQALRNAGLALNHARGGIGDTHSVFEPSFDVTAAARRSLEIDLRRALALRELKLVYQPQLDLASGAITGFEALLRWHHPVRGLVSPADFIPLAETTGLIVAMGEWVIRTACREAAGWSLPLRVAVNVSAVFARPGLLPMIIAALAETGLSPDRLEVEITESSLIGDQQVVRATLVQLKTIGVRISMDDFGTGYSSLSSLRSFPFDKIKIDQSFVRGKADEAGGAAIVRAIAALGHSLGMSTIAEGVETRAQFDRVASDGCTAVQGYLISRPMPPDQIPGFLADRAPAFAIDGKTPERHHT
jgi:diguanylate cyclase (GGDEF)-like protein